ncbi:MAG: hypothetical protein FWE57_00405 [Chitinispirillia bacterium]|nr:hypothetical protein [Chitinispirillia bacterium]
MNDMNRIQGSSAASWAQFVKLKQAARERNSGFTADGVTNTGRGEKAAPKKSVSDVYSEQKSITANQRSVNTASVEESVNKNIKGNHFDMYA